MVNYYHVEFVNGLSSTPFNKNGEAGNGKVFAVLAILSEMNGVPATQFFLTRAKQKKTDSTKRMRNHVDKTLMTLFYKSYIESVICINIFYNMLVWQSYYQG